MFGRNKGEVDPDTISIGTAGDIGMGNPNIPEDARSTISRIVMGELKKSVSCSILEGMMDHKGPHSELGHEEDEQEEIRCCGYTKSKRREKPRYATFLENILTYLRQGTERVTWESKTEFVLSLVGYAVGLGNLWRFPYLAYKNGGGAFLLPYVVMLLIAGLPLFFFELCFGQFASLGMVTIWKVCPLFKGVGYGMVVINILIIMYYNVIVSYSIYYMMISVTNLDTGLPWADCNNPWNTKWCVQFTKDKSENHTLDVLKRICPEKINPSNIKEAAKNLSFCGFSNFTTPSQEYWVNAVLRLPESGGIGDLGPISPKNMFALAFAWVLIYFCVRKGVVSSGKVVYFTATFPYFMLVALFIRAVTLPGYADGVKFYVVPKWEKILNIRVWSEAATQIFYSLGIAFGCLITMSSYNKFDNNCYKHAIIVAFVNCGTSIFGGFVIFSFLGYMAYITGRPVESVVDSGTGLVFVAYPEGLALMPVSSVWSFFFFFMIITLGMDSQFAMVESVISAIIDEYPKKLRKHKTWISVATCFASFLLGLPMVTCGGIYVLTLMDWFSASYGLLFICMIELVSINHVYGFKNFSQDIEMMLGFKPGLYWKLTWMYISPVTVVFILIMSAIGQSRAQYVSYVFETWAQAIGWVLVVIPILCIIIMAIVQFFRFGKSLKKATTPAKDWGPALEVNRTGRYAPAPRKILMPSDTASLYGESSTPRNKFEPSIPDQSTKL